MPVPKGWVELIEVQPIEIRKGYAFVDGPDGREMKVVDVPAYPEETRALGRQFRGEREQNKKTLGDAARLLNMTVADVSGIEIGRYTLSRAGYAIATALLTLETPRETCKDCWPGNPDKPCPSKGENCWKDDRPERAFEGEYE